MIYLIFCNLCLVQYVGETKNSIRERFRGHRTSIFSGKSNQIVHQHFHRDCHGIDNCVIIPIEKIESVNASEQMLNKIRKEREAFWQRTLQTMYPFGVNIRLKGMGDFNPSQGDYRPYFYCKRNNRSHGKRKPKSQRPTHNVDIPFLINFSH